MRRFDSYGGLPRRHPRYLLWLGAVLGVGAIVGLLVSLMMHPKGGRVARSVHDGSRAVRPAYVNRSILRGSTDATRAPSDLPTIQGIVYDAEGHPLRDAAVSVTTFEIAGNIPSTVATAKTDELGHFEARVWPGTYQVGASLEGFGPAHTTAHTGDDVSLVLSPSGVIVGRVMDEQGNPVSRFTIDVVVGTPMDMAAPPPVFSRAYDSLDGAFRVDQLPVWSVVVRASAEGYAAAYSDHLIVHPGNTEKVDLTLSRGCELTGKVVDRSGAPLSGVVVDAEAQFSAGQLGATAAQAGSQTESDERGRFRMEHVPTGSIVVRAYDGENAVTTITRDIADCAKVEPVELVMGSGGTIVGVARRSDGSPLPDARLTLQHRGIGFINTVSDADGRFRFDRLPAGVGRLDLVHEGQTVERMVRVEAEKEVKLDIALIAEGDGEVRGRVTAGKKPLAGMRVALIAARGRGRGMSFHYAITGADGTYRVSNLAPGSYDIEVDSTVAGTGAKIRAGTTVERNIDLKAQLAAREAPEADAAPASAPAQNL